jgi:hypothetical protein
MRRSGEVSTKGALSRGLLFSGHEYPSHWFHGFILQSGIIIIFEVYKEPVLVYGSKTFLLAKKAAS